jgi:chromosomal replication initiation ATPase DnaA
MQTLEELHNHYKNVRQRIYNAKPIAKKQKPPEKRIIDVKEAAKIAEERRREVADMAYREYVTKNREIINGMKPSKCKAMVLEIAEKHGFTPEQIAGPSRDRALVKARQEVMYELRMMGLSFPIIGRFVGNRDHTTCLHGYRTHKKYLASIAASEASGLRVDTECQLPTKVEATGND